MMLFDRRKAHAAIPEDNGCYAVPARGSEQWVPHRLPVVVCMQVNPTRRNQQTSRVDIAPRWALLTADGRDAVCCNCNVPIKRGFAGPIYNGASTNNDVVYANLPSLATLVTWRRSRYFTAPPVMPAMNRSRNRL
jgi:hypothetical protein